MTQRQWFTLHGWISLPIWIVFCFVCVTGTIAVVSHELTWLTNENARALNPNDLPAKPVAELVASLKAYDNTAQPSTIVSFESYLTTGIMFSSEKVPFGVAYVNQFTGRVQEINQGPTFISFMRSLHSWLLFPWQNSYSVGYYLVSAMSFVMLGALITGLVIYKRFWKALISPKIRTQQNKKTLLADLHKHAGVWSMWFLLVMSITGLWYFTQQILWHADYDIEPHTELIAQSDLPMSQNAQASTSLSGAMLIANATFENFKPTYIMLPEHNRDTYKVMGSGNSIFFDNTSYQVVVNPWNGDIEQLTQPATMGALQTIKHVMDPLHFGYIGGLWTKFIWFAFGILLSGMSITGFMIWGSRIRQQVKEKVKPRATVNPIEGV